MNHANHQTSGTPLPAGAFQETSAMGGTLLWVDQIDTPANDWANRTAVYGNYVYVAGTTANGGYDGFLRKYDADGLEIWTRQISSESCDYDEATGVAVDHNGNIYVVGYTGSVFSGLTNIGYNDGFLIKYAPDGNTLFTRQFGTSGDDYPNGVTIDSSGAIVVTGTTYGAFPNQMALGNADVFLAKFDTSGHDLWTWQFGTTGHDYGLNAATDASGNIFVAGYTGGAFPNQTSNGDFDAFVSKHSPQGDSIWVRQFGTDTYDDAFDVAVDPSGNAVVTGYAEAPLPQQTTRGAYVRRYSPDGAEMWTSQTEKTYGNGIAVDENGNTYVCGMTWGTLPGQTVFGAEDAFVQKYDNSGMNQWTHQFGSPVTDSANGIAVMASGDIVVAGFANGALSGQTTSGGQDAFLSRCSSSGSADWTRQFGWERGGYDQFADMALDPSGYIYAVGYTDSTWPGQVSTGYLDAVITRYDNSGNRVWSRQFGTTSGDDARAVATDVSGNAYVAGYAAGPLPEQVNSGGYLRKYGPDGAENGTLQFGAARVYGVKIDNAGNICLGGHTWGTFTGQTSYGGDDAFVSKYKADGSWTWTRQFGSANNDYIDHVAVDDSGNLYAVGSTYGSLPGQTSAGNQDAFIQKFDPSGNALWTRQFGTVNRDWAEGVAIDADGCVYVAGAVNGLLPGQTGTEGWYAFLRKYNSDGTELWTRQFTSSDGRAGAIATALNSTGNPILSGWVEGALPGQQATGYQDIFVRQYDASGNESWTFQAGIENAALQSQCLAIDGDENIFMAGFTNGAFPGYANAGSWDAVIGKLRIGLMGDVNGNGKVDLEDSILALEILAGKQPATTIRPAADVNGDGKIGVAEVIYILRQVAGF
ncbi:MAG: SBBP repeat-containing protein [Desulfatirhabdiaceae bacterium]